MTALTVTMRGFETAKQALLAADRKRVRSGFNAGKDAARWGVKTLRKEMRAGAPGGVALSPLSTISRAKKKKKGPMKFTRAGKPLASLARHVKMRWYNNADNINIRAGFVGSNRKAEPKKVRTIMTRLQQGYSTPVSAKTRRFFARTGAEILGGRSKFRKYFFLRKSTTAFHTPKRQVLAPFLAVHMGELRKKVERAYDRRMKK